MAIKILFSGIGITFFQVVSGIQNNHWLEDIVYSGNHLNLLIIGMMIVLFLYNMVAFISLREISYLYLGIVPLLYCLYIVFYSIFQHLPEDYTGMNIVETVTYSTLLLMVLVFLLFSRKFLDTGNLLPKVDKIIRYIIYCSLAVIILIYLLRVLFKEFFIIVFLLSATSGIAAGYLPSIILWKRNGNARFFLFTSLFIVPFFLSDVVMIFAGRDSSLTLLGIIMMILYLSFGVSRNIYRIRSDRDIALEAVADSELKYRSIVENAAEGIFQTTREGKIITANTSLLRILGMKSIIEISGEDKLPQEKIFAYPEERASFFEKLDCEKKITNEEISLRKTDGTIVPVKVNAHIIEFGEGKETVVEGIVEDISERKRAEEHRLRTEKKFRSIFENVIEGLFQVTPEGLLLVANPSFARLLGYDDPDESDFINQMMDLGKLFPDEDEFNSIVHKTLERKKIVGHETSIKRKDGSRIYVSLNMTALDDEDSGAVYLEGSLQDITDRRRAAEAISRSREKLEENVKLRTAELMRVNATLKFEIDEREKTEESLRRSEDRYRRLIETMNEGLAVINRNQMITYANTRLCEMTGYSREEVIGLNLSEIRDGVRGKIFQNIFVTPLDLKPHPVEFEIPRADGTFIPTIVSPQILLNEKGDFDGSFFVITDITEIKKAREELIKAVKFAEGANRAKSEFLANMSHEIRTPLNAILGFTDLLLAVKRNSLEESYLTAIKKGGESLMILINDVLDLSKIESGRIDIQYNVMNIRILLQEIESMFQADLKRKNLQLLVVINPDEFPLLFFDEVRLRQILFNLVGNAIKFTEKGLVEIRIDAVREANHSIDLTVQVVDSGIGIPLEAQKYIFESFRQYDSTVSRKYGGTGLGLAISRRLTEIMNGEISVESIEGKGSRFTLHFDNVPEGKAEDKLKEKEVPDFRKSLFTGTAIVADDAADNRHFLSEVLRKSGLNVLPASDGSEVLEILNDSKPVIIFLDIRMPVMGGFETLRMIKSDHKIKGVPVVAVSASIIYDQDSDIEEAGFDAYLEKPFSVKDVIKVLKKILPESEEYSGVKDLNRTDEEKDEGMIRLTTEEASFLEKNIKHLLLKCRSGGFVSDIESLGRALINAGGESGNSALEKFGEKIINAAELIDVEKIDELLGILAVIIEGGPDE